MAPQPHNQNSSTQKDDVILTLPNNITIRRYRPTDAPSLSHHANNKAIWNNLRNRIPHPYTEAAALDWITHCKDPTNWQKTGPWKPETGSQGPAIPTAYTITIPSPATGVVEACGSIGLEFNDPSEINCRTAELGYWLSEEHWGKGVMGIVVPAFVEWTWRTFGVLVRLDAEGNEGNVGSLKVLLKAGFEVEGKKRWAYLKNRSMGHVIVLGAVRPGFNGEG